jgi:hypothetical protein
MEYLDIELRRENALFISRTVFDNRIRIDDLQKCIDIIKNNNFASGLKDHLLDLCAPVFWNDLYYLNFYDATITELKNKLDTVKHNYECTDDIDEKYYYNLQIDRFGSEIDSLNTIIELTKQLRKLILETFHNIETLWKQKLIEHNAIQEKDEAEKLEREVIRAEIRKKNLNAIKKPDSTSTEISITHLICDEKQLQKLHADFDGKIWETVGLETFLNYMRVEPIGQIKIISSKKQNKILANWLHVHIENNRNINLVPNFGNWFKKLIRKNINYSALIQNN